jgi:ubiquitin-conjugating enzyme E2 Q
LKIISKHFQSQFILTTNTIQDEIIDEVINSVNSLNLSHESSILKQIEKLLEILCEKLSCPKPSNFDDLLKYLRNKITDSSDEECSSIDGDTDSIKDGEGAEINSQNAEYQKKFEKFNQKVINGDFPLIQPSRLATNRLMQEYQAIERSESKKNKIIEIELVADSLYEWIVKLHAKAFDCESPFFADLQKLHDKNFVEFHVKFDSKYPFNPPFIRVKRPVIIDGHIEKGGALCMEIVMSRGWSPAYSIESLFLQIASTIVQGKGRVNFQATSENYSLEKAIETFKWLENIYDKSSVMGRTWELDDRG